MRLSILYLVGVLISSSTLYQVGSRLEKSLILQDEVASHGAINMLYNGESTKKLIVVGPSYSLTAFDSSIISLSLFSKDDQVLNLSHNWHGIDVSAKLAIDAMKRYQPKILMFFVGDDLHFSDQLHPMSAFFIEGRHVLATQKNLASHLTHLISLAQSVLIKIVNRFNLYHYAYPKNNGGLAVFQGYNGAKFEEIDNPPNGLISFNNTSASTNATDIECFWLARVLEEARGSGTEVIFFSTPFFDSASSKVFSRTSCKNHSEIRDNLFVKILLDAGENSKAFFYNDTHLNINGMRVTSYAVAEYLKR